MITGKKQNKKQPNNIWLSSKTNWNYFNNDLSTWILKGNQDSGINSSTKCSWSTSYALGTIPDAKDSLENETDTSLLSGNLGSGGRRKVISK